MNEEKPNAGHDARSSNTTSFSAREVLDGRRIAAVSRTDKERKTDVSYGVRNENAAPALGLPVKDNNPIVRLSVNPTRLEIFFNWACQLLAIFAAVLFGVYSILAYYSTQYAIGQANTANDLSQQAISASFLANQVALLSLCQALLQQSSTGNTSISAGRDSSTSSTVCSELLQTINLSQLVSEAFPTVVLPSPTASFVPTSAPASAPGTASAAGSGSSLSTLQIGAIAGSIVGGFAPAALVMSSLRLRQRLNMRHSESDEKVYVSM
ncbi:MAG: hypothetical protein LQ340_004956 [Diploschistes diacapsis]|nr:MAG: hypothetical protein LQ340_004956 [Diploschistes diacapsis]